jgi:Flp pilus assembly protein TadG
MTLLRFLARYASERRGAAAVEYVFWLAALSAPIFGAADIGYYGYQVIQAHNAAQMAVQAAYAACASTTQFPATQYCGSQGANLNTAVANGEHSSSLASTVTMNTGSEEFMCVDSTGKLQDVSKTDGTIHTTTTGGVTDVDTSGNDTAAVFPTSGNCSGVTTGSTVEPGDYVFVTVKHTFHPLFKGFSVVNLLGGGTVTITQTDYTRLE